MEKEIDYEAAEAAGVAVYGDEWLTLEKLHARPHKPYTWTPVPPDKQTDET